MKRFILLNICWLSLWLVAGAQEKVYMPWIEVININSEYQLSVSRLFKTYVEGNNKYTIVLPAQRDTLQPVETVEQSQNHAREAGATYFLRGELNRMGELAILSLTLYRTSDGTKVWGGLEKAASPEDLDPVLSKLAGAMGTQDDKGNIYNVSDYRARELRRMNANNSFGFILGGGSSFVTGVNRNFPAGFGCMYQYDTRNLLLDLTGELYFSDVNVYFMSIQAWKPFSNASNTPFAGGGIGYGGVSIQKKVDVNSYTTEDGQGGLMLFAGGGYLLNRDATVSLRFNGRVFVPLFKVYSEVPAGVLVSVAILF